MFPGNALIYKHTKRPIVNFFIVLFINEYFWCLTIKNRAKKEQLKIAVSSSLHTSTVVLPVYSSRPFVSTHLSSIEGAKTSMHSYAYHT